MSFLSVPYLLFLPCVLLLYYILPQCLKNGFLLLSSLAFYLFADVRFGLFLAFSVLTTYFCGLLTSKKKTRVFLIITLVLNLGALLFFKYFNFLSELSFEIFAYGKEALHLELILPLGISFYTFQSLGYCIDVYRRKYDAEKNLLDYALFVSFFPQISSGPIGRGDGILPQLKARKKLTYTNIKAGFFLIIRGCAQKMLIADGLSHVVNAAFSDIENAGGGNLLIAVLCYSVQIYCDFAAYSDIARGSAKLFGVDLINNFETPYFAGSIKGFWRKWHISLSSWFRDYLYFPLGGSRCAQWRSCLNIFIVFVVSGMWHGAALTFIVWGALHGLYQIIGILLKPLRELVYKLIPRDCFPLYIIKVIFTFALISFAWIFFRAETLSQAISVICGIFAWQTPDLAFFGIPFANLNVTVVCVGAFIIIDFLKSKLDLFGFFMKQNVLRYFVLMLLIAAIFIFGCYGEGFDIADFVYFKF